VNQQLSCEQYTNLICILLLSTTQMSTCSCCVAWWPAGYSATDTQYCRL